MMSDKSESEVEQFDPADYESVREALREAPAGYGVESVIDYFDPMVDGGHQEESDGDLVTDGGADQSQSALANLQELDEPWRDEQLIRYLYHEKKLSGMRMASYLGCSVGTANRWIRRHGITRREHVRVPFYTHSDKGTECWAHSYKGDTDFVYVHRLVMIAEYGIDAVVKNDVHHINEIRWDNRPENLTLMTRGEHTVHHSSKVKGLDRVRLAEIYENGTMSCRDLASHVDHDITPGTVLYVHGQFYGGEAA